MKLLLWPAFALSFLFTASARAAADPERLKAELVRTETEFFQHALEHGFSAGLHAYMADDALIANSLILGRAAQGAKVQAEKDQAKTRTNVIRWKPLRADVSASGDLGYTWGVAESGPTKAGPFKPYGIYVTIWKRAADGKWKFVYDSATILTAEAVDKFLREKFPDAVAK
jgi:ketosteroid isomerase-like protein